MPLSRDENGVFHAYVRDEKPYLTYLYVTCDQTDDFTVTRMDTGAPAERDHVSPTDTFVIPDFTGTLMLKIDAVKGKDVTSVFLLVSRDETPPVLTLSDPIFYADKDTGEYSITGTADAGSLIHYGTRDSLYAGSDGSFTISGALGEGKNNDSLVLYAKDTAGNESALQSALVVRRGTQYTVTIADDGNGIATATPAAAEEGMEVTLSAEPKTGYHFKEWQVVSGSVTIVNNKFIMPSGEVKIRAIFEEDAASTPGEFTISFDGNGGTPSVGRRTTTDQKLASLPDASRSGSYTFDGWYTEKNGGTEITTATVFVADTTVYAHWTYIGGGGSYYSYYTIRATVGLNGSITPSGWSSVREGLDQTFTITPDKGYVVAKVLVDGRNVGAVKSYTFKNVTKEHTIEVTFRKAGSSPGTGDSGALGSWGLCLCASLTGCLALVTWQRRRRHEEGVLKVREK